MFDRGVAGTSTEDVQVAAGVSSSQLYHYFTGKQHLVRTVIAPDRGRPRRAGAAAEPARQYRGVAGLAGLDRRPAGRAGLRGGCPIGLQGGLLLTQVRRDIAPLEAALDMAIAHIGSFVV